MQANNVICIYIEGVISKYIYIVFFIAAPLLAYYIRTLSLESAHPSSPSQREREEMIDVVATLIEIEYISSYITHSRCIYVVPIDA
jgi:hypothetical protein